MGWRTHYRGGSAGCKIPTSCEAHYSRVCFSSQPQLSLSRCSISDLKKTNKQTMVCFLHKYFRLSTWGLVSSEVQKLMSLWGICNLSQASLSWASHALTWGGQPVYQQHIVWIRSSGICLFASRWQPVPWRVSQYTASLHPRAKRLLVQTDPSVLSGWVRNTLKTAGELCCPFRESFLSAAHSQDTFLSLKIQAGNASVLYHKKACPVLVTGQSHLSRNPFLRSVPG